MNDALDRLARELALEEPARLTLRLRFGLACVQRVHHLLEDPAVVACLEVLARHVDGQASLDELEAAATEAARLANHHPGSRSLDGVGHAAVSASYAVANALAGRALRAAEYAAYATVYGEGGYGAVQQRESFQPEFDWQLACLRRLAAQKSM
jgi:hypothetical protein